MFAASCLGEAALAPNEFIPRGERVTWIDAVQGQSALWIELPGRAPIVRELAVIAGGTQRIEVVVPDGSPAFRPVGQRGIASVPPGNYNPAGPCVC